MMSMNGRPKGVWVRNTDTRQVHMVDPFHRVGTRPDDEDQSAPLLLDYLLAEKSDLTGLPKFELLDGDPFEQSEAPA